MSNARVRKRRRYRASHRKVELVLLGPRETYRLRRRNAIDRAVQADQDGRAFYLVDPKTRLNLYSWMF